MSGGVREGDPAPLRPDEVFQALTASMAVDATSRVAAQKRLQEWETDSTSGFVGSLLSIVQSGSEVVEELRLMAAVVAKNAVGSSWRKTMGTREWSRVPDSERAYVRATALSCLISDPSSRVAVQLALLISNLARFDVPRPWDTLLAELVSVAGVDSPLPPAGKLRALKALKHTIRALKGKRFAIEAPQGLISLSDASLTELTTQIDRDRKALAEQLRALLAPLHAGWSSTLPTLLSGGELAEACGLHAAACLAAEAEALSAVVDLGSAAPAFHTLMSDGAAAAGRLAQLLGEAARGPRGPLLCKCWERLLGCALAGLDRHALSFAEHVPDWAGLCASTALLGLDAGTLHHIRTKSRVLLTRFTARVLIQPLYRPDVVELHATGALGYIQGDAATAALPALEAARDALDALLAPERCGALVEAVVTKYIALSPEELEEWAADPESLARQVDVETSPDADTPRPCGVALLECMLERRREPVAAALVAAARSLQAAPRTHATVLLAEATYRAIGECFAHVRPQVDFAGWYAAELRGVRLAEDDAALLGAEAAADATRALDASILRARALWLVGVCGEELAPDAWEEAFALCVRHERAADLVVALMAVSASTSLVAQVLEETAFLQRAPERRRARGHGAAALGAAALEDPALSLDDEGAAGLEGAEIECEMHLAAVRARVDAHAAACYGLLARVEESESMVRVLHAVSAAVELLGPSLGPHLGAITDALPGVWAAIAAKRGGEGPGAAARLHAALIGVLAHLVARLGLAAVREPRVAALLAPLLLHATDLASSEAEPLLDDGLRLWRAVLQHSADVGPLLRDMLAARFAPLVARGQDLLALYGIAEGYALLGGAAELAGVLPALCERAAESIGKVLRAGPQDARRGAALPAPQSPSLGGGLRAARKATLAADDIQEAFSAATLVQLLLRELPRGEGMPPSLLGPLRAACELAGADFGGAVMRLPARAVSVLEAALEVVCAALWHDPAAWRVVEAAGGEAHATRLLDRWISMSLTVDMAELFIAALATSARARRHESAVALAALLCADAAPQLRDPQRAARVIVLGLKCVREGPAYRRDLESIQENIQTSTQRAQDADQLVLRRLQLAISDPITQVDVAETVRAAAQRVAGLHGEAALLAALEALDPSFPDQLRAVMQGGEEKDMLAALEAMHLQRAPDDEAVTVLPTAR